MPSLLLLLLLVLVLVVGLTVPSAAQNTAFFLRPAVPVASSAAAPPDGRSYASAWRAVAHVQWSEIGPGDTLFVCGLGHGPFSLNVGWSGTPAANVRIDGNCPRPDGSVDAALWIGGDPINPFPSSKWSGPDAAGIFTTTYFGSTALGAAAVPEATEMQHVWRLARGSCDASGPTNRSAWPAEGFCTVRLAHGSQVYYRPSTPTTPVHLFGQLLGVVITTNNSDVTIENLQVLFGARPIDVNGGSRVTLRNNTLRWGSDKCIGVNSHAGHPGPHPGTQGMLITQNRLLDCACGLYTINQNDAGTVDNSMNSNELTVSWNNFTSIDPFNYYGNKDTHAIGIQGGSRSVYEHNIIDGAGGSGITFYQGPGQEMRDNVARFNLIKNVRDYEGKKNQRGIEFCDDNRAGNRTDTNNSVYYNILGNITGVALRTKSLAPAVPRGGPAPLGTCGWRFLNNVVLDAGVGFELQDMEGNPAPQGSCAINNIFACGLPDGPPCAPGYKHQSGVARDSTVLSNNLYFPDNASFFCGGGQECGNFATWAARNSHNAGAGSYVGDPKFLDARQAAWPAGLRLKRHSPAIGRGRAVGLTSDFDRDAVPSAAPDVGAFQSRASATGAE